MVEVQETLELNHETLYLAVKNMDLFLSEPKNKERISSFPVKRSKLRLLACASLLLAAQYDVSHTTIKFYNSFSTADSISGALATTIVRLASNERPRLHWQWTEQNATTIVLCTGFQLGCTFELPIREALCQSKDEIQYLLMEIIIVIIFRLAPWTWTCWRCHAIFWNRLCCTRSFRVSLTRWLPLQPYGLLRACLRGLTKKQSKLLCGQQGFSITQVGYYKSWGRQATKL